jgi:alginate O-acetyltransferase complex protein AlgJ
VPGEPPLIRAQVVSVYQQVLGRAPSGKEIDAQLAAVATLDGMLRVALDSEEYAAQLRERGMGAARSQALVNVFHPDLAEWGLPVGARSDDGIAIVGRDGWLFLCGGTNANLGQYVGAVRMEPGWLEEWTAVLQRRKSELAELGLPAATLVVPDKLAVYEDYYPEPLERQGPRPIERLLEEGELPIVYPLAELRAAAASGEEIYLRTDTHLTFRGNELLFHSVLAGLGVERAPDFSTLPLRSYPITGDLGVKFDPPVVSIVSEPNSLLGAEIVEDNRAEIEAVDGHIGTRRVFRNESAPDPRLVVIFGDSFGFSAPYYQGLSWFLAQVFREVHFVWVPFGWDAGYVRRVGAGAVLVQGAERFVARVPAASVDASRLAEETLSRKRALGIERIFH